MAGANDHRRVGRHPTTIAREVTGHGGRDGYRPAVAQRFAEKTLKRPRLRVLSLPGWL
jgi:IS30 family transposase